MRPAVQVVTPRILPNSDRCAVLRDMKCIRVLLFIGLLTFFCVGGISAPNRLAGANSQDKESTFIKPELIQGATDWEF